MKNKKKYKRRLIGKVLDNKMSKTITVLVTSRVQHPIYRKVVLKNNKYKSHDEKNQYEKNDIVEITESRPISKTKFWKTTKLIKSKK